MASAQITVPPGRLLAAFGVLVAVIYGLVFFTGDHKPQPKLGIDLQGGTRVTLTARMPDGGRPPQESLKRAQAIIETRVNGLGVSGSEVIIDGDNLVITVPGNDGAKAKTLGQSAKMLIRPVLAAVPSINSGQREQGNPGNTPPGAGVPGQQPGQQQPGRQPAQPPAQRRVFPAQRPPASPTPPPATTTAPVTPPAAPPQQQLTASELAEKEIKEARATRQSSNDQTVRLAMMTLDCSKPDPLQGNDEKDQRLVACSADGKEVLLLDKSIIDGQEIATASSYFDQQRSQNVVSVEFKSGGSKVWAAETSKRAAMQEGDPNKRIAFVLDTKVITAPQVEGATPEGSATQITGSFTSTSAKELATTIKYGSLPLSFRASEAETVSATLGLSSLRAGLLAGLVGLIGVLLYCLLYYRMLGVLTALSLLLSGVAVYGILVLLGRWMGFTLDLAGIAGLIIGIGMTADSFVVFFERIKDEMREGRSFRSAVPRGWARARRTVLSGNAVSFLATAVLWALAAGQVRGFAFTLGLTTILDVIIVVMVTAPLVTLASRTAFWARPGVNGLGAVQELARERKAAERAVTVGKA